MATQDVHAPTLGAQGEPCASCGAPLAADQRYCLECGTRREQARLPFRDILAGQAPPGAAPPGAPAASEQPARAGLAFLAGLLCLLVALGVGVLIGRSGDDAPTAAAPTPAPQVITVNGAAPAATTTTPATSTNDASGAGSSSPSSDASGRGGSGAKSSKGSKSSNKAVKDLDKSSGSDYQKKSQKLPKEVGTGGKPPPKDDKPAGGGTDFEDIG